MGLLRMAARTAVVAGTATSVSGRVARRQADRYGMQTAPPQQPQYAPPQQPQYAPPPSSPAPPGEDDVMATLQKLAGLHQQGVLSDQEFSAAKAKILGL
ncbi:MAG: SHOCT domain-containing protein [Ornithinimicrobium sp.]